MHNVISKSNIIPTLLPGTEVLPGTEQSLGTQDVHSDQGPTLHVSTHGTKHLKIKINFLFNGPSSASLLFTFGLFKQTIQILQQINMKKSIQLN